MINFITPINNALNNSLKKCRVSMTLRQKTEYLTHIFNGTINAI